MCSNIASVLCFGFLTCEAGGNVSFLSRAGIKLSPSAMEGKVSITGLAEKSLYILFLKTLSSQQGSQNHVQKRRWWLSLPSSFLNWSGWATVHSVHLCTSRLLPPFLFCLLGSKPPGLGRGRSCPPSLLSVLISLTLRRTSFQGKVSPKPHQRSIILVLLLTIWEPKVAVTSCLPETQRHRWLWCLISAFFSSPRCSPKPQPGGLLWLSSDWESACQFRGHKVHPRSGKIPHTAAQLNLCPATRG